MRFLHLSTAYPIYLRKLYARHAGLASEPFDAQRAVVRRDAFGWADFWTHYLGERGIVAEEFLVNSKFAQHAWAREKGIAVGKDWLLGIAARQVCDFSPDVLFLEDYAIFPEGWVRELRDVVPSIKLVVAWCGAPYSDPSFFRACDLVLSCIPELVEHFRSRGHRSELLRHGFDARILGKLAQAPQGSRLSVTFIGSVSMGNSVHADRGRLLVKVAERTDLTVFTPAADRTLWQRGRAVLKALAGKGRDGLIPRVLQRKMRPSVFGLEMFGTLQRSQVTLNAHISASEKSASNMRLYEATGVGTCLLTDWKPDLKELFEPDKEVVTYTSADECVDKVAYLLENRSAREAIAAAGQARTLRDHGFDKRAQEMHALLQRYLP